MFRITYILGIRILAKQGLGMTGPLHRQAQLATLASSALIIILIAIAAAWVIVRDRHAAVDGARQHLENFTVIAVQQTAFALRTMPDGAVAALLSNGAQELAGPEGDEFQRQLTTAYAELEMAYSGRLALFSRDGVLLSAFPRGAGAIGRNYGTHSLFAAALPGSAAGTLQARGIFEPGERLFAYRPVRGYPVVLVVSAPLSEILGRWQAAALVMGLGALAMAAFTAMAAHLLGRQLNFTGRLAQDLSESEMRLNSIIASAMDAIITVDESQHIVLFNAAAERIFGCSAREAVGSPLDWLLPERFRAVHAQHVRRFGESGATVRRMGGDLVLAGRRLDGEEFPIDASISQATVNGRKYFTVILRDITERQRVADALRQSHEELRALYESMHEVREAERSRIARELHDELAQSLTALKMDASWIATQKPEEHSKLVTRAERMKSVIDNTVAAVRRIAADLRPLDLDELGVIPALEELSSSLAERTGLAVAFKPQIDDLNLREPHATALYRMVQEALTNVARHANASSVTLDIRLTNDTLLVRVQDDGQGFKPDPGRKSLGVLGIRERARTLGGEARIFSPKEGGTVVEIEIPLERRAA
jgi:PAS domain S-box-containing protein